MHASLIDPAIEDHLIRNVHTNHFTDDHVTLTSIFARGQMDDLKDPAFQRGLGAGDARRTYELRAYGGDTTRGELIDLGRERC